MPVDPDLYYSDFPRWLKAQRSLGRFQNPAPLSASRKHVTNCFGYWQNPDDRSQLSTIEDEWGI